MKKIVSLITMTAMLAVSTPAFAGDRDRDYRWGNDRNVNSPYRGHHHRRDRGVSTEGAVAIGIGALVLGALIANNNRNEKQPDYHEHRRKPKYVCQDQIQYDYYGKPYVAGRECWYKR
jgi:hypothetical protein